MSFSFGELSRNTFCYRFSALCFLCSLFLEADGYCEVFFCPRGCVSSRWLCSIPLSLLPCSSVTHSRSEAGSTEPVGRSEVREGLLPLTSVRRGSWQHFMQHLQGLIWDEGVQLPVLWELSWGLRSQHQVTAACIPGSKPLDFC